MNTITSTSNSHIKQIRKLQERKERQKSGLFYAEGIRIVAEAVQQNAAIETLVVAPELLNSSFCQQIIEAARSKGVSILEVSSDIFKSIAMKEGPQGIAAVIRQQWAELETSQTYSSWVALDAVQNPGNLGTILRTAQATRVDAVLLTPGCTDPYAPKVVRAGMGAHLSLPLHPDVPWESVLRLTSNTRRVLAEAAAPSTLWAWDWTAPTTLVIGGEAHGAGPEARAAAEARLRLPMAEGAESLNAAVAAAVFLFEARRQRDAAHQ